jgi:hypothetical protein
VAHGSKTPPLISHDDCLGVFRSRHRLGSAILEHISLQPSLEPSVRCSLAPGRLCSALASRFAFHSSSGMSALSMTNLHCPTDAKQVPEIATDELLKTGANERQFLVALHVTSTWEKKKISNPSKVSKLK